MDNRPFYSTHIFIFPFQWELVDGRSARKDDDVGKLKRLESYIDLQYWEKFEFQHKVYQGYHTYNEFAYYYHHVHDILRIRGGHEAESGRWLNVLQYQYRLMRDSKPSYHIFIRTEKQLEKFTLAIEDIVLNLYPHGLGMLVFFLRNWQHRSIDDVLKINDYGRRIYPQFLGSAAPYTDDTKGSFLADRIELEGLSTPFGVVVSEDFSYYDDLDRLNRAAFRLPEHIGKLLGPAFYGEDPDRVPIRVLPVLDDRMFVVSHVLDSGWMSCLKKWNEEEKAYAYVSDRTWYQYIFVDGNTPSVANRELLRQQLKAHSYARWIENGQLFGVCRYAFVLVTSDDRFPRNVVSHHIQNQYFQLVLLVLLQRAHLIHFGSRVAKLSHMMQSSRDFDKLVGKIDRLYRDYIKFLNRIYFNEVTPQEQGIELYDMLQEKMRIKEELSDLDREISKLNDYAERKQEGRLTRFAADYLPVTLLAGILGMNTLNYEWDWQHPELWPTIFGILNVVIVIYTLRIFMRQCVTKKI